MPKTTYFFDFDHTLFNTDVFFHIHVRTAFLPLGIDTDAWERSYAEVHASGYTLEKHIRALNSGAKEPVPLKAMQHILLHEFQDLRRYLYPDVVPFLEAARQDGISLNLLSFGNPEWQRYKVRASGLEPYFANLFFTEKEQQKWHVVAAHSQDAGHIRVVDNNPPELDAVRVHIPRAQTYCISRVPANMVAMPISRDELARLAFLEARRYVTKPRLHAHIEINSLQHIMGL